MAGKFLDAGLVNKVSFFLAPIIIGGREAPNAIGGQGAETLAEALKLWRTLRSLNEARILRLPDTRFACQNHLR